MSRIPLLSTARTVATLYNILDRADTMIVLTAMRKNAATVDFRPEFCPKTVTIEVDANNPPLEINILHELIHVLISPWMLAFDETIEEVIVLALEVHLWKHISSNKRRLSKWQTLIARKVAEYEATLPETPIEEQIKR